MRMAFWQNVFQRPRHTSSVWSAQSIRLEEFDAAVSKVIDTLASGPAVALRKTKEAINAATLTELESAIGVESGGSSR